MKRDKILSQLEKQIASATKEVTEKIADLVRYRSAWEQLSGFPLSESPCACMIKAIQDRRNQPILEKSENV